MQGLSLSSDSYRSTTKGLESNMQPQFVSIERVLDFVDRTTARSVPLRVALVRAERRFGLNRKLVRSFVIARHPEKR